MESRSSGVRLSFLLTSLLVAMLKASFSTTCRYTSSADTLFLGGVQVLFFFKSSIFCSSSSSLQSWKKNSFNLNLLLNSLDHA